jgi:F0F1-type ATP synthase membrane subunit b/b'
MKLLNFILAVFIIVFFSLPNLKELLERRKKRAKGQ